jgi:hypothetical protein
MSDAIKNLELTLPEPGIHSLEESYYHSLPYISKTGLDYINKSPQHFIAYKNSPQKPTPAMLFGSALHASVLEPHLFKAKYVKAPDVDKRTNVGKSTLAEFLKHNIGKTLLDPDDFDRIQKMTEEIYSHPTASKLLSGGEAERSLIFDIEKYGIRMKSRVDYLKGNLITDLKTCEDASADGFQRSVAAYRYHVQAGVYSSALTALTGSELQSMAFIAIEKKEPFGIGIYLLDDFFIDAGKIAFEKNMQSYAECVKSDKWPGFDVNPVTLTAPRWMGAA